MMLSWEQGETPVELLSEAHRVALTELRKDLIGQHHADGLRRSKHVEFACPLSMGFGC